MQTFTNVQFMTAKEKILVLNNWTFFLKNGLKQKDFTKALYSHLTQHAAFIAHYSREGFFDVYFSDDYEETIRFLKQFDLDGPMLSAEYGGTWCINGDYHDINRAMCVALEPFKEELYRLLEQKQRDKDLTEARRLLAKHGG